MDTGTGLAIGIGVGCIAVAVGSALYYHFTSQTGKTIDGSPDISDRFYNWVHPGARLVKSILQMAIGLFVVLILLTRFAYSIWGDANCVPFAEESTQPGFCYPVPDTPDVLNLIADGLAAAAVIELAYTLFTAGPDEALDPLLLGLSAAIILLISHPRTSEEIGRATIVLIFAAALVIAFAARRFFVQRRK